MSAEEEESYRHYFRAFDRNQNGTLDFRWSQILPSTKEVIKEQPSSRNLSATAARVLQCTITCPVAASRKDPSATVKLYCHMIRYMYKTGC
jgi:hypothetical protein